jgi:predicted phage terminase large subunit-like protein
LQEFLKNLPSPARIRGEKARRSLAEFTRQAWHVIEPGVSLEWNWHLDAICEHLEAVTRGEIRRLIINVPPGAMKSTLVCVMWPAWQWTHTPEWRALFGSYALKLAMRDSVKTRDVITSEWYREAFGIAWELKQDQDTKSHFVNSQKGFRDAMATGAAATGLRGDAVVIDDPISVKQGNSALAREAAFDWIEKTTSTRLNDMRTGARVLVMHRLHEWDPAGLLLKQGGWEHLFLPAEFDPIKSKPTSIGWCDPRTERGELLFPNRINKDVLEQMRISLGDDFAGQFNQDPAPGGGIIFKGYEFKLWAPKEMINSLPPYRRRREDGVLVELPAEPLPPENGFTERGTSWDFAFKGSETSDRVVGQAWADAGPRHYLLDQVSGRMDFNRSLAAIKEFGKRHPLHRAQYIEDKANGTAIMNVLSQEISGLIPVSPKDDKVTRAKACTPAIRSGHVYLPHPSLAPWVEDLFAELEAFPKGAHDDQVDALTQWLNRQKGSSAPAGAMVLPGGVWG